MKCNVFDIRLWPRWAPLPHYFNLKRTLRNYRFIQFITCAMTHTHLTQKLQIVFQLCCEEKGTEYVNEFQHINCQQNKYVKGIGSNTERDEPILMTCLNIIASVLCAHANAVHWY